ncbi:MAG: DUF2304 domain-containing protein [Anaerolineae bacterium]|nr:DUF2304 domain-containing protein [Anaerolineae bacterium]
MYDDRPVIMVLVAALGLFIVVFELVRQRKLKEQYSLLWLATGVALVVLAASRRLLDVVAVAVGIAYPPTALFLLAFGFLLLIVLQFSVVISRLSNENKKLAQEVAILQYELRRIAGDGEPGETTDTEV